MDMQLGPELEDFVKYNVERSNHQFADQHVEHAVSLLHAFETWFAEDRAENLEG
jgi:hypothetical protein